MNSTIKKAQSLLNSLKMGNISKSYYDMAWVLRSTVLTNEEERELEKIFINEQKEDGSWGGAMPYLHDRVINTLSVVMAFLERGLVGDVLGRGIIYLQKSIPLLNREDIETIGFELTFSSLLRQVRQYGVSLPYNCLAVKHYDNLKKKKLALIPAGIFYETSTLLHSLEAFDRERIDFSKIKTFPNGSLGNSPAATAFYVKNVGVKSVPDSVNYLCQFKESGWQVPSIYPFEVFEKAWVLYNFLLVGILDKLDYKKQTDYLWEHWQKAGGASISNSFPIIDSDDTAVVYIVLKETGYPVSAEVFEQFEEEEYFRCFDLERNPSISANIHILDAIRRSPEYKRRNEVINKILRFLEKTMTPEGSWLDKWHVSPYYCTGHALIALDGVVNDLEDKAIKYFKKTQNEDGGWGVNGTTKEETFYATKGLEIAGDGLVIGAKGYSFFDKRNVEFWIDKGLYCPIKVIKAIDIIC